MARATVPHSGLAAAIIIGTILVGGCGGDDSSTADTGATTSIERPPDTIPPVDAVGCPPPTRADIDIVTASLDAGLSIAAATAENDADVRYIVASIYNDGGYRVSSIDTWAMVGGQLVALSGGARDLSNAPDGRDALSGPGQWVLSDVHNLIQECAQNALAR